ncbi:MAG: PAS domain S-box protein [Raineya sp.]|jgi:PAS domain S-box-containing protein|nr:PAS domain S-box protein [Raineya sp.]
MSINNSKSELKLINFPGIKLLMVSSLVIFIFYAFLVTYNYLSDKNNSEISGKALDIEKLIGEITNYDEILTMSAKMYVATSNTSWEKRYNATVGKLDLAIKKSLELAPSTEQVKFAKKTDEANQQLIDMETKAFNLVASGKPQDADSILTSSEYEKSKSIYASGLRELSGTLRTNIQKEQRDNAFNKTFINGIGALSFIIMIILAISSIRRTAKFLQNTFNEQKKKLEQSEMEMRDIAEKQLEANEQLFLAQRQMQQKNAQLEASEQETKRLLEEQEKANQKLAVAQRELQKNLVEQNRANQKLVEAQKEIEQSEKQMRSLAEAQLEANEQLLIAQKQIQEQTQKMKQAFIIAKSGAWGMEANIDGTDATLTFSDEYYALLGTTAEEQGGYRMAMETWVEKFLIPEDAPDVLAQFVDVLKNEEFDLVSEFRLRKVNGEIINYQTNLKTKHYPTQGKIKGEGIAQDITERKQIEAERELRNKELKEAFKIAKMASWRIESEGVDTPLDKIVCYFSDEYYALLGTTAQEQGGYKTSFKDWIENYLHPKSVSGIMIAIEQMAFVNEAESEVEYQLVRVNDKQSVDIQTSIVLKTMPNGSRVITGTAQDVTERKKIEQEKQARQQKIQKFNEILTKLSITSYEEYGSLDNAMQAITEALADGLEIDRASVWDYTGASIISHDLYEKDKNSHSKGVELFDKDFPAYFDAVKNGLVINAQNAHTHPNTFEFSQVYLTPLRINSMLDVPIRVGGELAGVVCCEYVGNDYKEWSSEDETFARGVADIISLTIEADKRQKAQEELAEALDNQKIINESLTLAQKELSRRSEELERSEKEMRALAEAQIEANEQILLAQRQLQATTALQKGILEGATVAIISTTTDGIITSINPIALKWLQYTEDELVNKQSPAIFHDINEVVEMAGVLSRKHNDTIEPGFGVFIYETQKGLTSSYEYTYNRKDGSKFLVSLSISAIRDEKGNITGYLGIAEDITERKKAEEEVKKLAEQFQDLFNSSRDGLLLLDDKGFFQCNEAAIEVYGCNSKEDLIGKTPIDYSPAFQLNGQASGEAAMAYIQKAMQEGSSIFEWTHIKKDGTEFPAEVLLSAINFEGKPALQATVRDITERKKAEQLIQEQSQKMKQAFLIAKSGAWGLEANIDGSNALMTLSDEYFAILNTSIEEQGRYEFTFQEWMDKFIVAEDHTIIINCLGGVLQNAEYSTNLEVRLKHPIYGFIYTNTVISTKHDSNSGKVKGQGTAQDITERKKAEEEVKRLSLVASKTDNTVVITNGEGLIEWVNDAFVELTEYTFEEVKGKKPGSFLQGVDTNPEDVEAIRMNLKSKTPFYHEIYNYSKSGRGYWLALNITPILDENGNVIQFIAIESDITERKKAFERIKKSEEEMRLLAEAQLEANERLMMAEMNLKKTLEQEQQQKAELDKLVGQLKDTQIQLVHNEKMASLGQLTAGIAHEINNPINFVYNGIDTLKISLDDLMEIVNKYNELDTANGNKEEIIEEAKQLKDDLDFEELTQDIEHLVSDIKKGAVRTMEIVKGLRVFSRLDEEERKMANIKDCLDSTIILLNNKIKGRVELKKYYDESMPDILCYPGQLNQVFMNIINNAIQAVPEERKDGVIEIYTENLQENIVIRIKDNGTGMSEQVKRRIFEPFFTTKAVGVGTGLGLSITFGIIEKHNGNIFVNSEEGRGTEFVIQLPKALV